MKSCVKRWGGVLLLAALAVSAHAADNRTTQEDLEAFPVEGVSAETPGFFAFSIPPLDDSPAFLDMSFLNPRPAGASGRVRAQGRHFVDGEGKRVRLLGSNLTFGGAFPDKEIAAQLAGHMRKIGFNVVRFHHIDMTRAPRGLWLADYSGFDPEQLDRLDWLIHQLKEHGIYTNLNLHVSFTYRDIPKEVPRTFRYGKALDNFYPAHIAHQKEYARALLTHRNPYTGMTYAEDPAIVVVETNNENSLTRPKPAELAAMPDPWRAELRRQWNAWLKARYGDTEALKKAWKAGEQPLGENLLRNADFSQGPSHWLGAGHRGAKMRLEATAQSDLAGARVLRIETQQAGPIAWSLQFMQTGLTLENGKPYTLRFKMRADKPWSISTAVRLGKAPWAFCGLRTPIEVGPKWRTYEWTFISQNAQAEAVRFELDFKNQLGVFHLAEPSLRPGGVFGLKEDQSLERGNIALPFSGSSTLDCRFDLERFLGETERAYFAEMYRFVKEDLGVEAMVSGTQASYGGLQGMLREASISDYCDMHSYWQHPHFPVRPWHSQYWYVPNLSMAETDGGGTLASLAWYRCLDKPFTVSEYDHPAPMWYNAELFPMIASFAAFQDWDGIYQFTYSNRYEPKSYAEPRITSFFSLFGHPGKKAFAPVAAVMFRMGAVAPGQGAAEVVLPQDDADALAAREDYRLSSQFGRAVVARPVGFRLRKGKGDLETPSLDEPAKRVVSNTGQIVWDADQGVYSVNAPAVRLVVGRVGAHSYDLGDVSIQGDGPDNQWACIAVCALDGKPIGESQKVLIAAVSRVENTGMRWNANGNSVGKNWGEAPTVAQGVAAKIVLPRAGKVVALDGTGKVGKEVDVNVAGGKACVRIGPEYETLWYGVTP